MKKILSILLFLLGCGLFAFAQANKNEDTKRQAYLEKVIAKEQKYENLSQDLHGWHYGINYTFRSFGTIGVMPATKHGAHLSAGYRFNKHWYLGGIIGADFTSPKTITRGGYMDDKLNYSIEREDKVYVPIIFEPRFYFNYASFSTYLYMELGKEFSHSSPIIAISGLGFDVHVTKSQCVNFAFGVGLGGWESADSNGMANFGDAATYEASQGFVFEFKLGYSF